MIRIRVLAERARSSLFFVPVALIMVAVVLSISTTAIDVRIQAGSAPLPDLFISTVDSARALLSVVASATIAFAGVSISISLLLIQLASSQFSPRVLYGFFRDPVTKWVTGIVIATFTYCLLILRIVRASSETGATRIVPHLSVLIATALGVFSIVAVVGLINHSARSMQVGQIIRRITDEGREQIEALGSHPVAGPVEPGSSHAMDPSSSDAGMPRGEALSVDADDEGWVQLLDVHRLLDALPDGTTCTLRAFIGGFVPLGSPLCELHPVPDAETAERVTHDVRKTIHLGKTRTTQQDVAFVFRQLIDIALRALSPGINDPTTAEEALVHLGSLLRQLLARGLDPPRIADERGRQILRPSDPDADDYVDLAFGQIRRAAASQPSVMIALLDVIGSTVSELARNGGADGIAAMRREARLAIRNAETAGPLPEDLERIRSIARRWDLA